MYDLPPSLLSSLVVGSTNVTEQTEPEQSTTREPTSEESAKADGAQNATSCALCKATFTNVQEQRQHVRSDFHRYNLKMNLKQMPTVDEATFIRMIGDLDESISGSESSTSEDEEEPKSIHAGESTLSALLRRQAKLSQMNQEQSISSPGQSVPGKTPILWMQSSVLDSDIALGVYRAILSNEEQENATQSLIESLKRKQLKPTLAKHSGGRQVIEQQIGDSDPHFFLCMIGGGHFAAMIVSLIPEIRKGPGGIEERHAIVRAHKTFHRYTTRRKQGGSQSANDNSKGNAHSAGSSIRRYNEAALELDIRTVLADWRSSIDSAELLFIRATGNTNRKVLFGPYDGQVLRSNDKRLRGFPFSTRRATQAELLRSFQELTRLTVRKFEEKPTEQPQVRSSTPKSSKPKPSVPQVNEEEQAALLHTTQLHNLIRRSKAPGLLLYLSKNSLSPNFTFSPPNENHHAPTPLHLSSSSSSPALVTALLVKANADPTIKNEEGKTAYDIAGDGKTRDAFRVARHQIGEKAFDWSAAHVPSALTQEEVEAKIHNEKTAATAAETKRRQADLEHIRQEEESRVVGRLERKAGTGKSLADIDKTGSEKREEEMRGLSTDMRQRLERERRARAAEERFKKMQNSR